MQEKARSEGRHVGIGVSSYVEVCGFGPAVLAEIGFSWANYGLPASFNGSGLVRVNPDGTATVLIGTGPSGQGHQTTWAQIVSDGLGIPMENIKVFHGDTAESPMGVGTFGSRSIAVDGAATYEATQKIRRKAAKLVAHMLEASEDDIVFADGQAHVAGSPDKAASVGGDRQGRLSGSQGAPRDGNRVSKHTGASAPATPPGRSAPTWRWSRWIRRRATSRSSSTSVPTTAGM